MKVYFKGTQTQIIGIDAFINKKATLFPVLVESNQVKLETCCTVMLPP